MTNLTPKKINTPETTELNDEILSKVVGGRQISLDTENEADYECLCMYCGAKLIAFETPCAVCGEITSQIGAYAEG